MQKNFIFDCDGVLIDSELLSNSIYSRMFASIGYQISAEDCIKKFAGLSENSLRKSVMQESGIYLTDEFFTRLHTAINSRLLIESKPLITGVLEYVSNYNIKACVASSSKQSRVIASLESSNIMHFFSKEHIFNAHMVTHGKPAPDLFLYAAQHMNFAPSQTVVIEDSIPGIQAGLNAGMQVIAFLGGGHAQYSWYQDRISSLGVPMAKNSDSLLAMLQEVNN